MALPARRLRVQFTAIGAQVRRKVVDIGVFDDIELVTENHAYEIVEQLQEYPPIPPGSTYNRTGDLGRSWRVRRGREGQNTVYFITNDVSDYRGRNYATFVQGQYQTSQHATTGWKNIEDYVRRDVLKQTVQGIITRAAAYAAWR